MPTLRRVFGSISNLVPRKKSHAGQDTVSAPETESEASRKASDDTSVASTHRSTVTFENPDPFYSDAAAASSSEDLFDSSIHNTVIDHPNLKNLTGRRKRDRVALMPTIPSESWGEADKEALAQAITEHEIEQTRRTSETPSCSNDGCVFSTKLLADNIVTKVAAYPVTEALKDEFHLAISEWSGWDEKLALCIMHHMLKLLQTHLDKPAAYPIDNELTGAYFAAKKVSAEVCGFKEEQPLEHPVSGTVVTLGVLSLMLPNVVFRLGYHNMGLIPGTWAHRWKTRHSHVVSGAILLDYLGHLEGLQGQKGRS